MDAIDDLDAWSVLKAGAADVFAWNHTDTTAEEIAARFERWAEIDELLASDRVAGSLVGQSPAMREALCDIVEAARFSDGNILLTGESGTGKELAARLIHDLDRGRAKGPFVAVDCTTIVPTLAGSEFFGHERGAFTGAVAAREGAFARADGGTLFLDEVAELPPALQAELLRVVQEGTYKRVGGDAWQQYALQAHLRRLSSKSSRRLRADRFRYDFFYRIASLALSPAADARTGARTYRRWPRISSPGSARKCRRLDPRGEDEHLERREYAGNVRELKHLIDQIGAGATSVRVRSPWATSLPMSVEWVRRRQITPTRPFRPRSATCCAKEPAYGKSGKRRPMLPSTRLSRRPAGTSAERGSDLG